MKEALTSVYDFMLLASLIIDDFRLDDEERRERINALRQEVTEKYGSDDVGRLDEYIEEKVHGVNIVRDYYNRISLKL